jgi:hypothetical protein
LYRRLNFRVTPLDTRSKVIRDAQIQPESVQLPQNFGVVYFVDRVFMNGEEVNTAISDHFKRHPNTALCLGLPCSPEAPIDVDVDCSVDEPALDIRETPLAPPPDSPILVGGYRDISSNEPDVLEIAEFATSALSQGANKASPFVLSKVVKAERQVVAGFNYRLQMELKDNADSTDSIVCNIVVFDPILMSDQSWTSTRQITSSDCNPPIIVPRIETIPELKAEDSS